MGKMDSGAKENTKETKKEKEKTKGVKVKMTRVGMIQVAKKRKGD